jgi:hypothetical protein
MTARAVVPAPGLTRGPVGQREAPGQARGGVLRPVGRFARQAGGRRDA